jgi:hypothetical protein
MELLPQILIDIKEKRDTPKKGGVKHSEITWGKTFQKIGCTRVTPMFAKVSAQPFLSL